MSGKTVQFSVGDAIKSAKARRITINGSDPSTIIKALEARLQGYPSKSWFAPAVFQDDLRKTENWTSTQMLVVDVDFYSQTGPKREKHAAPPAHFRRRTQAALMNFPATLGYHTPRGVRVIRVLEEEVRDSDTAREMARSFGAEVQSFLEHHDIASKPETRMGLRVDRGASGDIARAFFLPNIEAGEHARSGEVFCISDAMFCLSGSTIESGGSRSDLSRMTRRNKSPEAPDCVPAPRKALVFPPRKVRSTLTPQDAFQAAVQEYNEQESADFPPYQGVCPMCRHRGCFGHTPKDKNRWICFSSNHGRDSNGAGVEKDGCWTGDLLDIEACQRSVGRKEILIQRGLWMTLDDRTLSDSGGAERFAIENRLEVCYLQETRTWFWFDGSRWVADRTGEISRRAKATVERLAEFADKREVPGVKSYLRYARSQRGRADLVRLAADEPNMSLLFRQTCQLGRDGGREIRSVFRPYEIGSTFLLCRRSSIPWIWTTRRRFANCMLASSGGSLIPKTGPL